MNRSSVGLWAAGLALLAATATGATAQVTTATVTGTVTAQDGRPLSGAQVSVTHANTGFRTGALTNDAGRYFVPFLEPGGPYTIEVQLIGFATSRVSGMSFALGQTAQRDFTLSEQAVELEGLVVEFDPDFSTSRTGQQEIITDQTLRDLPTISRNFTELASLSPLVSSTGSPSINGQNNRFNNIQLDGAVNNDVFGLAASGVPGGQANGKPISQDAIAEFQVLVAPFDVRQAGFTGGLINAVTKSGTNRFSGSLYGFYRDESLERGDFTSQGDEFSANEDFTNSVIGGTLGGPIIKDKLHFFLSGEFEIRDRPLSAGVESSAEDLGVSPSTVTTIQGVAENQYNLPFGRTNAFTLENPATNLFGRLDWQINDRHRLSLKHTYADADSDDSPSRGGSTFEPESATFDFTNETNSTVAQLFSNFGRWNNEFLVNVQFIRDRRANPEPFRFGEIRVENPDDPFNSNAAVLFGTERFSHANELDQDVLQFTNNLTGVFGDHRWTVGVNVERWSFRNLFASSSLGVWEFDTVDDFQAGDASFFEIALPSPGLGSDDINDTAADFAYTKIGAYIQDEISVNDKLTVTAGVRVDVPVTGDDPRDNEVFSQDFGGRSTTTVPSGNPLIQPRVGFNYRVDGNPRNQIRGGAGIFAGRPPFVWVSNAFGNTGLETVLLRCFGGNTPQFDGRNAPTRCADNSGASTAAAPIALVDEDFAFPQDLKVNLAWDRDWGEGWKTTFEGVFTKVIDAVAVEELNGNAVVGHNQDVETIGPRKVFGRAVDDFRQAYTPIRASNNFLDVIELTNTSEGYSYSLIGDIEKNFGRLLTLRGAYTYSRSFDLQAFTSSRAVSNYGFSPVGADVGLDNLDLRPSDFDRPHRVILQATTHLWEQFGGTTISAIYRGESGAPYSYIYRSDVNGDGFGDNIFDSGRTNDLVFIPQNSSDILWDSPTDQQRFDDLVSQEECLQDARGEILERNACRRPWAGFLNLRLTQGINLPRGNFELILDIFNVMNLLNEDWGAQQGNGFNTERLLEVQGRDDATGRLIMGFEGPLDFDGATPVAERPHRVDVNSTRYRINLGLRYIF
ncbi:MAG: TonB-dependent receptor [Longimicrobiales bacterium]|nr:TonB-dependent receptor [Longimicrobiales bacterium]